MSTVVENATKTQLHMGLRLAAVDAITLCATVFIVACVRLLFGGEFTLSLYISLFPIIVLFPLVFAMVDLYPGTLLPPQEELKRSCISITACFLFLGTVTFFSREAISYSRMVFIIAWIISMMAIPVVRSVVRNSMARKGKWGIPAVFIGTGPAISIMARNVRLRPRMGLKTVGLLSDSFEKGTEFEGVPVLGKLADAAAISAAYPGCYAIISDEDECSELGESGVAFDQYFSRIILLPNSGTLKKRWAITRDIGGMAGLELRQNLLDARRMQAKRLVDFCAAFVGLLLLSPFFLLMALWVKSDNRGPVFFGHNRIGQGGKTIKIWKFRSMVANSDQVLADHLASCEVSRKEWEENQKLQNDPRITRSGRFLRKTSLDELPQLWNVLVGDISLVGPRPIVEAEKSKYKDSFELYSRIRPGITGLWQISGRNLTTYDERIDLDSYYVRNWSIWFDIYILSKTIPVVLTGHGAF